MAIKQITKKLIAKVRPSGLSQTEISRDEEHHNNNTDNVKYVVHACFFLSFIWLIAGATGASENIPNRHRRVQTTR